MQRFELTVIFGVESTNHFFFTKPKFFPMKNTIYMMLSAIMLISNQSNAQQMSMSKCLGGNGDEIANVIEATSDGGYIIAGSTTSSANGDITQNNHGGKDFWVVKLNASGNVQWEKNYGGSLDDVAYDIHEISIGEWIVVGSSCSADGDVDNHLGESTITDIWIIRINNAGNILWKKSMGSTGADWAVGVEYTGFNEVLILANTNEANNDVDEIIGANDYWLIKMNLNGNVQWQNVFGGTENDYAQHFLAEGNVAYLFGHSNSQSNSPFDEEALLIKVNTTNGDQEWSLNLGTNADDGTGYTGKMGLTPEGDVIITYNSSSSNIDNENCNVNGSFLVKTISSEGDIQSGNCYGGSGYDQAEAIIEGSDDEFWLLGNTTSQDQDVPAHSEYNDSGNNCWLSRMDENGTIIWSASLGGSKDDKGNGMARQDNQFTAIVVNTQSSDGNIAGFHAGGENTHDIWLAIFDENLTTPTEEIDYNTVGKIFPNPANNVIQIDIPRTTQSGINIIVADINGKVVYTKRMIGGNNALDISALPSGFYTVQLIGTEDNNLYSVQKLVKE
jgi:Secretion system C-terminal sorting domain